MASQLTLIITLRSTTQEYNGTMPDRARALRSRDRHGRGIRHSLSGSLYKTGSATGDQFANIIATTCDYLRETWPKELSELNWRIMDAPVLGANSTRVKRWSARQETMTVVIYRLPILRLDNLNGSHPVEDRVRIEHYVFEAAAELIGKEPWELIFGNDSED
jgi:expansin (peptidoglycan-binding protein)